MPEVELVLDLKSQLGEGPSWDFSRHVLYWVDINGYLVHIYDPKTGIDSSINIGQEVSCAVPRKAGGLVLGLRHGFGYLDIESGKLNLLIDPENHIPNNRFNDGKCDPRGRFWAGTMSMAKNRKEKKGAGSLYCLYPDLTIRTMIAGVTTSNGMAWSADQRAFYYIDTPTHIVSVFDYDPENGEICNGRRAITFQDSQGSPDGMTIDEEGMLWIAHWGGSCVSRWSPQKGELLELFKVPAPRVTSCAFGGLHLDELYITTARTGLDEETLKSFPYSGGLFKLKPGVRGVPEPVFQG